MKKIFTIACLLMSYAVYSQVTPVNTNIYPYDYIVNLNGTLLFFATSKAEGNNYELWRSDGTEAGTMQVKDINGNLNGSILSNTEFGMAYNDRNFVIYNNEFYFIATDGPHGLEIWKSDGTAAGTMMLKDIYPGPSGFESPSFNFPYFTEFNGKLFFAANDNVHGFELWSTDGTEAGTQMVKNISADEIYGSNPEHLIVFNNMLYFAARDDVYGYELYKSDGTAAGTQIVKDIVPGINGALNNGYASSIDPKFTVSGDYLYFIGRIDASLPVTFDLFRTDGTDAGTITLNNELNDITNLCDVNGTMYCYAFDGNFDHSGLWKSDGTPGGTVLVNAADVMASSVAHGFYNFNEKLFFSGFAPDFSAFGLATSDGSGAGTNMVYEFESVGSIPEVHDFNSEAGSDYFFYHALTKISDFAMSIRMVQTNGSNAGTKIFSGVQPFRSTEFLDGDLYFGGIDSTDEEVWGLYKIAPVVFEVGIENYSTYTLSAGPNPVTNQFIVSIPFADGTLSVYDMTGREVNTVTALPAGAFAIDVVNLMQGCYVVKWEKAEMIYQTRMVVTGN